MTHGTMHPSAVNDHMTFSVPVAMTVYDVVGLHGAARATLLLSYMS